MAWEKSPPALVAAFERVMDRFPEVKRRQMFGYPAATLGGNMVTGLHQANWVVRLSPEDQELALGAGATVFEVMPGRVMKNFVALPATIITDDDATAAWIERGIAFTRTLPAK
jgi:hypothetical protein